MLTAAYAAFVPAVHANGVFVGAFAWLFVPAASSYLALQLTGSSTFTGMSGVRKELRYFLPVHLAVLTIAVALLVARAVTAWRAT